MTCKKKLNIEIKGVIYIQFLCESIQQEYWEKVLKHLYIFVLSKNTVISKDIKAERKSIPVKKP